MIMCEANNKRDTQALGGKMFQQISITIKSATLQERLLRIYNIL